MNARLSGLLAGLFFLLMGGGQIYLSFRLQGGLGVSSAEPGPGLFPAMVGTLMVLACTSHIAQVWFSERIDNGEPERLPVDIFLVTASLAIFILLLTRAGFVAASFFLLFSTLTIYGLAGLLRRISIAAVGSMMAYFVFKLGLGVSFPQPTWLN
jgi:hypothetical protein